MIADRFCWDSVTNVNMTSNQVYHSLVQEQFFRLSQIAFMAKHYTQLISGCQV